MKRAIHRGVRKETPEQADWRDGKRALAAMGGYDTPNGVITQRLQVRLPSQVVRPGGPPCALRGADELPRLAGELACGLGYSFTVKQLLAGLQPDDIEALVARIQAVGGIR